MINLKLKYVFQKGSTYSARVTGDFFYSPATWNALDEVLSWRSNHCVCSFKCLFVCLCYFVTQLDKSASLVFCYFCTDCMKFQNWLFANEKNTTTAAQLPHQLPQHNYCTNYRSTTTAPTTAAPTTIFEVLTAVSPNIQVLSDVTPCQLLNSYRRFEEL